MQPTFGEPSADKKSASQLLEIFEKINSDEKIVKQLAAALLDKHPGKFATFEEAEAYVRTIPDARTASTAARLIEKTFGKGTFRTLSFLDTRQDTGRSVRKLLGNTIERGSFAKQVESGYYLNLLENYGVEWPLDKVTRDSLQNFFDANGQTLDGVRVEVEGKENAKNPEAGPSFTTRIEAPQDYDWKELVHFGGTTKQGVDTAVGGFGEGLKIAAFVLLRDLGASKVVAASRDWTLEYYFDDVASDAYRTQVKGLYAKKRIRPPQTGNYLEVTFTGEGAKEKAQHFIDSKEFFYSSNNPDFSNPSFNNKSSGGFAVLPILEANEVERRYSAKNQNGRLYLAGQRTHYRQREEWDTVLDVHLWTWKKIQPKDRDRGMVTEDEMKEGIVPFVVNSMSETEMKKSVYDFQILWDKLSYNSVGGDVLKKIVDRLAEQKVTLEFPAEYLANDMPFVSWIADAMKAQGHKMCGGYMSKIGMKKLSERFKEAQSHIRVEANEEEKARITVLQKAARQIGIDYSEIKDVWLFNHADEKTIFHGQYNDMFYWLAKKVIDGEFLKALEVYVHEAAHTEGPHGNPAFEYGVENRQGKIRDYILKNRAKWDDLEEEWKTHKIKTGLGAFFSRKAK